MTADTAPPGPPPPLDGYEVFECVGVGGLGAVYRARHLSTGTEVAIKLVRSADDDPAAWRRIERELRALAGLRGHAHVVGVLEVVPTDNYRALVVEFAPGGSINDLVAQSGQLSIAEIVFVGRQVAHALESAHERGIVHRDIKPHNLLIDDFGQIKVCDFGVASLLGEAEFNDRTSGLSIRYASPEDVEDEPDVLGPPSDIYSLGATLLFLRRGAPPTAVERVAGWVPPHDVGDADGARVDDLIAECLRLDPLERPTASVLHARFQELDVHLGNPIASLGLHDDPHRDDALYPDADQQSGAADDTDDTFAPPAGPPETLGAVAADAQQDGSHIGALAGLADLDSTHHREMRAEFRAAVRPTAVPRPTSDRGVAGRAEPVDTQTADDEDFWGTAGGSTLRRPALGSPTVWPRLVVAILALVATAVVAWAIIGRGSDARTEDAATQAVASVAPPPPRAGAIVTTPPTVPTAAVGDRAAPTDSDAAGIGVVPRPDGLEDLELAMWPLAERGKCMVQRPGRAELAATSCDQPHDLQSLGNEAVTDGADRLDDDGIRDVAADVCARLAADSDAIVGDELRIEATVPSAAGWADGDRVIQCWLRAVDKRLVGDAVPQ